jgi:ribosomal protein L37AE/L43A
MREGTEQSTPPALEGLAECAGSLFNREMDDLEHRRRLRRLADEALDVPNCPECLHPLVPVDTDRGSRWACVGCGTDRTD